MSKKIKKPWPTKAAMEQVYEKNLWGGREFEFYSGDGSHNPEIVNPYIAVLKSFLSSFENPLTVCDLGCGDFNVGKELVKYTNKYIAVDIVKSLIENNKEKFVTNNVEFHCMDITVDKLPSADCVVLRQVLQHLSNAEVHQVLDKLSTYKFIVLTEHVPNGDFVSNKDIISGQGIRLKKKSGLNLLESPFNLQVKEEKELLNVSLKENKGVIVTTLYQIF
jgi:SAM-dependent methyltransferase